ncbi:hypothetical protein HID58_035404, partial [Brassica napus]
SKVWGNSIFVITADEQVKGYGTRLMNHLKQHARDVDGLTHFLTHAQQCCWVLRKSFTWRKMYGMDYDGGLLMECKIDQKLPYTELSCMIRQQRKPSSSTVYEAVVSLSICSLFSSDVVDNFGDAGWTPDQWGHTRYKLFNGFVDNATKQKQLNAPIRTMQDHANAWPFKEPVDALDTIAKRVESEEYYVTLDMFVADARRMFNNCRTYNSPDTIYYKCATSQVGNTSSSPVWC